MHQTMTHQPKKALIDGTLEEFGRGHRNPPPAEFDNLEKALWV
jgi:hypothetical protein